MRLLQSHPSIGYKIEIFGQRIEHKNEIIKCK